MTGLRDPAPAARLRSLLDGETKPLRAIGLREMASYASAGVARRAG